MVRIAAGICTYSDAKGLDRLLSTIEDNVDLSIIIHGRYPNFPQDDRSLNDTMNICKSHNNIRLTAALLPMPETHLRQTYLKKAQNYDFLLVLDSDEYVTGDWDLFRQNCQKVIDSHAPQQQIYNVPFDRPKPQYSPGFPRPRLFYKPSTIKYYRRHCQWLLPSGQVIVTSVPKEHRINGITIWQDNTYRTEARQQKRQEYVNWLGIHEAQFG